MARKKKSSSSKTTPRVKTVVDRREAPEQVGNIPVRKVETEIEHPFYFYPDADAYTHEELGLDVDRVLEMYRNMLLQRRFEERARQMYMKGKIAGFLHLYIGQEAVSTGSIFAIREDDYVITAYRDHGQALARGMSARAGMAELFGKITGCSKGKGGSMHFFDVEHNFLGGHAIVGGHIPLGVGVAFACKYKKTDRVCLTFFGDGAINQGAFHEAANLAGLYKLPAMLICENNEYGMGTPVSLASAEPNLYKRAVSYRMPGVLVNGMDVFTVYKAVSDMLPLVRQGQPVLMEVRTYRYQGHSMSDPATYRTKEELEAKKHEDPVLRMKSYILRHDLAESVFLEQMDKDVREEVMDAVRFADESPEPPPEELYTDVYVQEDYPFLNWKIPTPRKQ